MGASIILPPKQVWSLLSGLNLHKLEPLTHSAVTGLTCLHDNKVLAVGWSHRIVQYDLSAAKVKSKGLEAETAQQRLSIQRWTIKHAASNKHDILLKVPR